MLNLIDGDLYQWDTGRTVSVQRGLDYKVTEVHFTTTAMSFAYVVKTYDEDGSTYCQIPNVILQQYQDIYCYEVKENRNGEESVSLTVFSIQKRNKPEDYIYTEQDKIAISDLLDKVDAVAELVEDANNTVNAAKQEAEEAKTAAKEAKAAAEECKALLESERAKLKPYDIREGVTVLGITGTMSRYNEPTVQTKTVTPSSVEQTITPDANYDYLSEVIVEKIPYSENTSSTGATTIIVG